MLPTPLPIIREETHNFKSVEFGPPFLGPVDLICSSKRSQPNVEDGTTDTKSCSFPEGVFLPLLFCQRYIFSHLPWRIKSGFMQLLNTLAFVTLKIMHLNVIFVTMCPACKTLLIISLHSN